MKLFSMPKGLVLPYSSRQIDLNMLLEFWILGCQISKVRWLVLVPVPCMHGLIEGHPAGPRNIGWLWKQHKTSHLAPPVKAIRCFTSSAAVKPKQASGVSSEQHLIRLTTRKGKAWIHPTRAELPVHKDGLSRDAGVGSLCPPTPLWPSPSCTIGKQARTIENGCPDLTPHHQKATGGFQQQRPSVARAGTPVSEEDQAGPAALALGCLTVIHSRGDVPPGPAASFWNSCRLYGLGLASKLSNAVWERAIRAVIQSGGGAAFLRC